MSIIVVAYKKSHNLNRIYNLHVENNYKEFDCVYIYVYETNYENVYRIFVGLKPSFSIKSHKESNRGAIFIKKLVLLVEIKSLEFKIEINKGKVDNMSQLGFHYNRLEDFSKWFHNEFLKNITYIQNHGYLFYSIPSENYDKFLEHLEALKVEKKKVNILNKNIINQLNDNFF